MRCNRFLPEYVTRFRDRHGKDRLRFRPKGFPARYLNAPLGSEEFREEYRRFNSPEAANQAREDAASERSIPGSIGDLLRRYVAVPERLGPTEVTRTKVRSILERFAADREDRLVRDLRFDHIYAIISKARVKGVDERGRAAGGVEAARKLRKELRRFFGFAVNLGWLVKNPVDDSQPIRVAPSERSSGYHTWSEDDIAQFRCR